MHAEGPGIRAGALVWLPLDLMDLDSVAKAAEQFMRQEDQLDVLGASAQCAQQARGFADDGDVASEQCWSCNAELPDHAGGI